MIAARNGQPMAEDKPVKAKATGVADTLAAMDRLLADPKAVARRAAEQAAAVSAKALADRKATVARLQAEVDALKVAVAKPIALPAANYNSPEYIAAAAAQKAAMKAKRSRPC